MFIKIFTYFWSLRHQFARYFMTGIFGLFLDMGSLVVLKEIFGWTPLLAVIVNQAFLLVYIFLMNKYWSFKNHAMPQKQVIRFLTLTICNYCFAVFFMYVFNERYFNFDYRLVRLSSIAVMVSWNFFLYKYWVYKTGEENLPKETKEAIV